MTELGTDREGVSVSWMIIYIIVNNLSRKYI